LWGGKYVLEHVELIYAAIHIRITTTVTLAQEVVRTSNCGWVVQIEGTSGLLAIQIRDPVSVIVDSPCGVSPNPIVYNLIKYRRFTSLRGVMVSKE